LPENKFDALVLAKGSGKYYKTFTSWDQLVGLQGKLNQLGMDSSFAKSTAGDGLRNRDNELFKDFYFQLIQHFKPLLSVSRIEKVSFEKLFIFDSTTIRLFSDIMKGVGRNPKNDGNKKGGLKVHMMIDAHADCATYARISEAKMHDKNFLQYLKLAAHSMIVFDKAYNHYLQFAKWTNEKVYFVCRMKSNAVYEVVNQVCEQTLQPKEAGVLKEEHVHLKYQEDKVEKTLCLRKITYQDDKGRIYMFICNNFEITNQEIAFLYKKR